MWMHHHALRIRHNWHEDLPWLDYFWVISLLLSCYKPWLIALDLSMHAHVLPTAGTRSGKGAVHQSLNGMLQRSRSGQRSLYRPTCSSHTALALALSCNQPACSPPLLQCTWG